MSADSLGALRRSVARALSEGLGADATPALDARLLVAAALGIDPGRLPIEEDRPVQPAEQVLIADWVGRRLKGEPVARIVGYKQFWGLNLQLAQDTLVPRPDTETVVETALDWIRAEGRSPRGLRILDIGTGSGAILLALLSELPDAVGLGVDISRDAARTAARNAETLGLAGRALFVCGNWADCSAPADVIVSNPPYIRAEVIATLAAEVRDHDPMRALDGGADGLDAYRAILADLPRVMAEGGAAFFEIGYDQAKEVAHLASEAGFDASVARDLAGHDRVIKIRQGRR